MIKEIIEHVNTQLETLNFVKQTKGLCQTIKRQVKDEELAFPAEFCNGEYKSISDFDFKQGLAYHRLNGDVINEEQEDAPSGCDIFVERSYPLKLVGVVKKSLVGTKDQYTDVETTETVINTIQQRNVLTLAKSINADEVDIVVNGYNVDRYSVHDEEYENIEMKIGFEYVYFSIDYSAVVRADITCFDAIC